MNLIRNLALSVVVITGILIIYGFFKPWVVLWWEPVQTRRRIIKLYGTVFVLTLVVYILISVAL